VSTDTQRQRAMWKATLAARNVIAQSKNPRTTIGKYPPTTVAFHVAWAAVTAFELELAKDKGDR